MEVCKMAWGLAWRDWETWRWVFGCSGEDKRGWFESCSGVRIFVGEDLYRELMLRTLNSSRTF